MKTKTSRMLSGLALAAGVAALGVATQAAATEANPTSPYILLKSATMDTKYTAHVGVTQGTAVDAYSNGVTFSYENATSAGVPLSSTVYTLFGFCVDITHSIQINTNLNYTYADSYTPVTGPQGDPLPTDFHGDPITPTQLSQITALVDTGWLLHESEVGKTSAYIANVELQLAAIQAAIWHDEGAYVSIDNGSQTAGSNVGGAVGGTSTLTYLQYYNDYAKIGSGNTFTDLGDANDTFYTIVQASPNYDNHQSFAVGWPITGVPEPATWAMMLVGFGGLGALLRARRQRLAAA